jgi:integrase/recombinase XerD
VAVPELTLVEPQASAPLVRLVEEYLAHCRARGLSPKTVTGAYGYPLREVFLPFCAREGIKAPAELTGRVLDRLSTQLLDRGGRRGPLSKSSVHSYLRAVNQFLVWARKEGEAIEAKSQLPRLPKRLVEVLSREEIDRLEEAAGNERDKLIVRTLADTGIRLGELLALRLADVIERDRRTYLRIRGKGERERLVPLMPGLYRRLRRYGERGRPKDATSDRLFLALRRRPGGDYEPLTDSGVEQMLRALGEKAGVGKRLYPHLLRHSFATWSLTRGMNPIQLAQVLGHTSLDMINDVYQHLAPQDAYEAMARALLGES